MIGQDIILATKLPPGGAPTLEQRLTDFVDTRPLAYRLSKRALDIALSSFALVMLLPVFVLTAVVIKLTSPGPVFFVQYRVGKNGRLFPMFKFRSMAMNCDQDYHKRQTLGHINSRSMAGNHFKTLSDPRVTKVGRIIRKTSIDELQQLINVLMGHMSLVGPRPCLPYEFEVYEPNYRRRVCVEPGLTGLAQVSGRVNLAFNEIVALDLNYVDKSSLLTDLLILLRTPIAVLHGVGAF